MHQIPRPAFPPRLKSTPHRRQRRQGSGARKPPTASIQESSEGRQEPLIATHPDSMGASSIIHHPSSFILHPSSFPAPVIGNLELMPLRMNIGKKDRMTERQPLWPRGCAGRGCSEGRPSFWITVTNPSALLGKKIGSDRLLVRAGASRPCPSPHQSLFLQKISSAAASSSPESWRLMLKRREGREGRLFRLKLS